MKKNLARIVRTAICEFDAAVKRMSVDAAARRKDSRS